MTRRTPLLFAVTLLLGSAQSCPSDPCKEGGRNGQSFYAVVLVLIDSASRQMICDAEVLAVDGEFSVKILADVYQVSNPRTGSVDACFYYTGSDRPGTYLITVTHPRYQTWTGTIVAPPMECSVETQNVSVTLTPRRLQ